MDIDQDTDTAKRNADCVAEGRKYQGGPDGPICEPGDDVPSWSDVYTADQLAAALDLHAAKLAKRGYYEIASDMNLAAIAIGDLQEQVRALRDQVDEGIF